MNTYKPDGLIEQRAWMDEQDAVRCPCWACGQPSKKREAAGEVFVRYDDAANSYECPHCGAPMVVAVPFVAVDGVTWHWSKPDDVVVTGWERKG